MATITPLRMLNCFVLKLVPHLSFSNPPLPLWLHKGIFFVFYLGVVFILMGSESGYAEPLRFGINTAEGGIAKPRYQAALERWLLERGCVVKVVAQVEGAEGDWVFDVRSGARNEVGKALLIPLELSNEDLDSLWVIRRTALGGGIDSLKGERIALLSDVSIIGYQRPLEQLIRAGVRVDQLEILQSDQYQGAMTLLLHGDVFAAAIPRVFAHRWLEPNDLAILYNPVPSPDVSDLQAGIWSGTRSSLTGYKVASSEYTECIQALTGLRRSGRRDLKMRLFPEWVTGFTLGIK